MANIDLTISINSDYATRILDALTEYAEKDITLVVARNTPVSDVFQFSFNGKGEDTSKVWGQKVIKSLLLNLVKCYEYGLDRERFDSEVSSLTPISQDVPDDSII